MSTTQGTCVLTSDLCCKSHKEQLMQTVVVVVCDPYAGTVPKLAENIARYCCGQSGVHKVYLILQAQARADIPQTVPVVQRYYNETPVRKVSTLARGWLTRGYKVDFYFFEALDHMASLQIDLLEFAAYCKYRCLATHLNTVAFPIIGTVYVPLFEILLYHLRTCVVLGTKGGRRAKVSRIPTFVGKERGTGVSHLVSR